MTRQVGALCVACALLLTGCPKKLVVVPDRLEYGFPDPGRVEAFLNQIHTDLRNNRFELDIGACADVERPTEATPLFSFVHVSDVQVRDEGLLFLGKRQSEIADKFAGGTQRTAKLDRNDEVPYLALIGAINALPEAPAGTEGFPPKRVRPFQGGADVPLLFVLHTGDATDVGTRGELLAFVGLGNALRVPWFNAIGNHDVLFFGNFTQDDLTIQNALAPGALPTTSRRQFVKWHGRSVVTEGLSEHLWQHGPTLTFRPFGGTTAEESRSFFHGFDRATWDACVTCDSAQGRRVPAPLTSHASLLISVDPPLRLLILDTMLPDESITKIGRREFPGIGAEGYLNENEFDWLNDELAHAEAAGERVILAAHHPLAKRTADPAGGGAGKPVLKGTVAGIRDAHVLPHLLRSNPVRAYLAGHTHSAYINRHREGARQLLEVVAPSTHELPQVALLVTLLRQGERLGLDVRPIRGRVTSPGPLQERLALACAGAREERRSSAPDCWQEDARVCGFAWLD